jgi:conjugative transposon TraM protein
MQTMTIRARRTQKALFFLPLFITPFLCLSFWAAGGGQGATPKTTATIKGLNIQLPDPLFTENKELDKWAYYAQEEALKKKEAAAKRKEGYWDGESIPEQETFKEEFPTTSNKTFANRQIIPSKQFGKKPSTDQQSEVLLKKLAELEQSLAAPTQELESKEVLTHPVLSHSQEMAELNGLMEAIQETGTTPDPEMDRLDSMLDKILKIQQGNWEEDKIRPMAKERVEPSNKPLNSSAALPANATQDESITNPSSYFYSVDAPTASFSNRSPQAMVYGEQVLVPGAAVHLLLLDTIQLGESLIPAFTSLYGTTSLQGDRLQIAGKTMIPSGFLQSVSWQVVDMDGIPGITVPASLTRESLRQSAGQAVQGIDLLGGINPSLSMQAATAGIQAAKTMLSKRTRQVKVNLPSGYRVWLQIK